MEHKHEMTVKGGYLCTKCKAVFDTLDKKTAHNCFLMATDSVCKFCSQKVNPVELKEHEYYCEQNNTILLKCNKCTTQVYGQATMRDHHKRFHRSLIIKEKTKAGVKAEDSKSFSGNDNVNSNVKRKVKNSRTKYIVFKVLFVVTVGHV